jgi:hypothetical protein
MEKEPSSFEKKLIRIKESGFWDAFRFTKDGHFKSTLLIYSFSLSFVFIAVYIACYWLLIDPIEFGLREVLSTRLLTLADKMVASREVGETVGWHVKGWYHRIVPGQRSVRGGKR